MDEYIKREDAIKHLRGACIAKYPLSFSYGIFASADEISKLPTADVVPKSEVDQLKQLKLDVMRLMEENARLAKSQFPPFVRVCREDEAMDIGRQYGRKEVARIICEIEEEIVAALESNYKAKAERLSKPNIEMADEFVAYCDGKIHALRGIDDFVSELKKKYTEEKT